ncbi:MAG TPA: alpha/beta hydrolase [Thiolinea sp.]|nr:alpha/beta hydrolase [Thiolinea sp.]
MPSINHHFITCRNLEIHYTAWGAPEAPKLIMWHGLSRTGRDFDEIALSLSDHYYVICPDTPGRGLSQWSSKPEEEYVIPFYAGLALELLDKLGIDECDWLGTSMGGLIGMVMAMLPESAPRIRRMVLNDVGPEIPAPALERIKVYANIQPEFDSIQELQAWQAQIYQPFGQNTPAFWRRMAITSSRRKSNGKLALHYDPALTLPFRHMSGDEHLWDGWPLIQCPMLIIRGALSDLLLPEHAERMLAENPHAQLVTFPDVGHAPTLASPAQIQVVRDFLLGPS